MAVVDAAGELPFASGRLKFLQACALCIAVVAVRLFVVFGFLELAFAAFPILRGLLKQVKPLLGPVVGTDL